MKAITEEEFFEAIMEGAIHCPACQSNSIAGVGKVGEWWGLKCRDCGMGFTKRVEG